LRIHHHSPDLLRRLHCPQPTEPLIGSITLGEIQYQINEDFKNDTLQLADALDLDELEAASLLLQAQEKADDLDRSALATSIITFHQRRQLLTECLRISMERAAGAEHEDAPFRILSSLILQREDGQASSGSVYLRKCVTSMTEIEQWLQRVAESIQRVSITGQVMSAEFAEIMDFQRDSLLKQHESLSTIIFWLVKANHGTADDLRYLHLRMRELDRYDAVLIHYLPVLACLVSQCASSESHSSLHDARSLHQSIISSKDSDAWPLRNFQAMSNAVWLAEYAGRYLDQALDAELQGIDLDAEADARSNQFMDLLKDGAFHFMLLACQYVKGDDSNDATESTSTTFLTQDSPSLQPNPAPFQKYFHDIFMEQMQAFVDAFITNMPDTLRKLKFEEDEQRRQVHGRLQLRPAEYELHLERFLVIISLGFQGFPEAAQAFWADTDGNLYGFLQWAAQRQSTPRAAMFCEMLRALSEGEECGESAHRFLLEDSSSSSTKLRRNTSLGWSHIFSEIEFYSSMIKDRPMLHPIHASMAAKTQLEQLVEPESSMMLECYLRLLTHVVKESTSARQWILANPSFHLTEHLLLLCRSAVDSRLRATAFKTMTAMLTRKDREVGETSWTALDAWISGGSQLSSGLSRPSNLAAQISSADQYVFEMISSGFEEPTAFVALLQALVAPYSDNYGLNDSLPFPEVLGSAYRMPGIDPYIDFAMDRVFATKSVELQDPLQLRAMRSTCLDFAATCLSTFNEDLIVFANKTNMSVGSAIKTSSLSTYARIHPFARMMEWFFNDRVISALFSTLNQDVREVNEAATDSSLVMGLLRSIEIVDLILTLQTTYLDIIRPIVKLQSPAKRMVVANAALASFEDAIQSHLDVVTNLGFYCGSGHQDLVLSSLRLLQKLSSSRKLANPILGSKDRYSDKNRLITALERQDAAESVSRSFISAIQIDFRELEQGPDAPGVVIIAHILNFLNTCLDGASERPTIAHLLLGFTCHAHTLTTLDDGIFATGRSLFHSVLRFVLDLPDETSEDVVSWIITLKDDATQLLRRLWKSPLSAAIVTPQLRLHDYLFAESVKNVIIGPRTLWDGRLFHDPDFFVSTSTDGFVRFLQRRVAFFELAAMELSSAYRSGALTINNRIKLSLLGSTVLPDGRKLPTPTVFDLLDFLEFDMTENLPLPLTKFFNLQDFAVCSVQRAGGSFICDLQAAQQLLSLRKHELRSGGKLSSPAEDQLMEADGQNLMFYLCSNNRRSDMVHAHTQTLRAWVHLVITMLEACDFDAGAKQKFALQTLQLVLPRLEQSYADDIPKATMLAQLGRSLSQNIQGSSPTLDTTNERFAHLFRISLAGVQTPSATMPLREPLYQTCHQHLRAIISKTNAASARKQALQNIVSMGDRLFEVVCDDAYAGEGTYRTSALLLLEAFVALANVEKSRYVVEALTRLNFIHVIVNNIKDIPTELQNGSSTGEYFVAHGMEKTKIA